MISMFGAVAAIGVAAGTLAIGAGIAGPSGSAPASAPAEVAYQLPLAGSPAVAHPFDAPAARWAAGHRGVDLAAEVGALVLAPGDGTVTFAGTVVDRGVVTLSHADGLRSSLEPVEWSVGAGDRVLRGQAIGSVQAVPGHCAPASCVHWGVRHGDAYLDPLLLLAGAGRIILLPDP